MTLIQESGRLADLSRVVELALRRQGPSLSLLLKLVEHKSGKNCVLEFYNVSELRFRGRDTDLRELVLLFVEDVSSNGWEGVRFVVKDSEEEFISFRCERIERG